jgi:hypothetical protein
MDISNLLVMILLSSLQNFLSVEPNIMSSIYLANKNILIKFVSKESRIGFAHYKVVLEKKILKSFIPYSRSLLKPIERLMKLVHMIWKSWIFKARWLFFVHHSGRGSFKNALFTSI